MGAQAIINNSAFMSAGRAIIKILAICSILALAACGLLVLFLIFA
jgi:hypothetical protein